MKEFDDIELSNKTPVHMESRNVLGNTKGSSATLRRECCGSRGKDGAPGRQPAQALDINNSHNHPSSYSLGVPCVCVHVKVKDGTHNHGQWKSLNKMIFISLIHSRQIPETLRESVLWLGVSNNPVVASYQLPGRLLSRVHWQLVASTLHHQKPQCFTYSLVVDGRPWDRL